MAEFIGTTFGSDSFAWAYPLGLVMAAFALMGFITVMGMFSIWLERKVSAHMQDRLGPMEVGPHGLLQSPADGAKLIQKEDIIPAQADRRLFMLAPFLVFIAAFVSFVVLPFGEEVIVGDLNIGILYFIAVSSLAVIGIIMAGWASNNKWSLLGAMRSAAQIISYEIPLGLAILTVVVLAGTLNLREMVEMQAGPIWNWYVFRSPFTFLAFFIYFVSSLAEVNRTPFDLPEAESELVAGYHTEYSGMRFAIFFLAEYANMFLVSAIAASLFLGGWNTGLNLFDLQMPDYLRGLVQISVIIGKGMVGVFIMIWLRWTLPRLRIDQLMNMCWKVLIPFAFVALLGSCFWALYGPSWGPSL